MIDLTGKTALITGGSRGIGRATAILMARAGADVAVGYQANEAAAAGVKEEVERLGRKCLPLRADISKEAEVRAAVERLVRGFGRIDILVNNAGIWTYLEIGSGDAAAWKETMAVNLDSVFYFTDAVVPHMKRQGGGRIINVGSTAGVRGEAFHSHYAATKGAVQALTKSWAAGVRPVRHPRQLRGARLGGHRHVHRGLQRRCLQGTRAAVDPPEADPASRGHRRPDRFPGLGPQPAHHRGDHQRQRRLRTLGWLSPPLGADPGAEAEPPPSFGRLSRGSIFYDDVMPRGHRGVAWTRHDRTPFKEQSHEKR